jgi:hypothetical protein
VVTKEERWRQIFSHCVRQRVHIKSVWLNV